jgi:hypothetical protein
MDGMTISWDDAEEETQDALEFEPDDALSEKKILKTKEKISLFYPKKAKKYSII